MKKLKTKIFYESDMEIFQKNIDAFAEEVGADNIISIQMGTLGMKIIVIVFYK